MSSLDLRELTLESWIDFVRLSEHLSGFAFRGQSDAAWALSTSLERTQSQFAKTYALPTVGERWALHEFKSKFHLYSAGAPADDDQFEWLAILQHHGCPTRLLDFTRSIYIALHFAAAHATGPAAIWCLSHWEIRDGLCRRFDLPYKLRHALKDEVNLHHKNLFNSLFPGDSKKGTQPHLIPLESVKLSARVARQQALFFAPTTVGGIGQSVTFEQCLLASISDTPLQKIEFAQISLPEVLLTKEPAHAFGCIKIVLQESLQASARTQLAHMSLTEEGLFPDLDGLARSLVMKHLRR